MGSTSPVKIHMYHVQKSKGAPRLSDIISKIHSYNLESRLKLINQKLCRMESLEYSRNIAEMEGFADCLCFSVMNFKTGHSPGQADKKKPLTGVDYDGGAPGEDVAVLYDPSTSYMVVQYSQSGPRAATIQKYLNEFAGEGAYELKVKFDLDFERKYQSQKVLQRFHAKIDTTQITSKEASGNESLRHLLRATESLEGTVLDITIGVDGRDRSSSMGSQAKEVVGYLKKLSGKRNGDEKIKKLESKGPVDGDKSEIIDLLGGKLVEEIEVPISTKDYRMEVEDRWVALFRAYKAWKNKGLAS